MRGKRGKEGRIIKNLLFSSFFFFYFEDEQNKRKGDMRYLYSFSFLLPHLRKMRVD